MKPPQPRSIFWVVTTHVLTTLFMLFLIGGVLGVIVLNVFERFLPFVAGAGAFLTVGAFGAWAGARHSISYLRKRAIVADPATAATASIATLAALCLGLIFLVNLQMWNASRDVVNEVLLPLGYELLYATIVTLVFAFITRRRFPTLTEGSPGGFEVTIPAPAQKGDR